jgi:hypothetical protein
MVFKFKLGKLPVKLDRRTLRLSNFLKILPTLPEEYDLHESLNVSDNKMFLNDIYGCCVISGRAHNTMVFEKCEQNTCIDISDKEIKEAYFYETGGIDSGLIMLNSLNVWRKGWKAANNNYSIYAFASLDTTNQQEIKASIFLLNGVYAGIRLPISAKNQTGINKVWEVDSTSNGEPGSWGGHCVYLYAYNAIGPICMTWGAKQQMTWNFWYRYTDEAYAIVDNKDDWLTDSVIDIPKLEYYLKEITGNKLAVTTMSLPECIIGEEYNATIEATGGSLPYTWSIAGGNLPPGIIMQPNGVFSGISTDISSSYITFLVTDSSGYSTGVILQMTSKNLIPVSSNCKIGNTIVKILNIVFLQKLRNRKGRFMYMNLKKGG